MKGFLEYVTKQLVDNPDEVQVDEIIGEHTIILELHVGDGDLGKVIGKKGRTAGSLRTLVAAATANQGKRSVLEIVETNEQKHKKSRSIKSDTVKVVQ